MPHKNARNPPHCDQAEAIARELFKAETADDETKVERLTGKLYDHYDSCAACHTLHAYHRRD
jgi:Zn-dependent membrane protease YugP